MEEKIPQENKPDWVIGDLYRQAWEIIKKHKVLWIFGMAAGAGVSLNNFRSSFDNADFSKFFEKFNGTEQTGSEINNVLGSSTSYLTQTFFHLFSSTPLSFYIILGIEFLFLIAIGIAINIIYSSWATGSLLAGIQTAIEGDKPTIKDSSEKAIRRIKPLIWLSIVPISILGLSTIGIFSILSLGLIFLEGSIKGLFIFLLAIGGIIFIIAMFVLLLTQIWAQRQVIIDGKNGKDALFAGFQIVRKKFWAMLLLGIVNNVLILIVIGIPIGIIIGLFAGGLFTFKHFNTDYSSLVLILVPFVITIVILFVFLAPILGGIINAFKATVWSLAYNNIKGKYDK